MRVYSRKVRDYVPTAKKIKVHKGSFRGQSLYDLLSVMDLVHWINWMSNPTNEFNCESCRENIGSKKKIPLRSSKLLGFMFYRKDLVKGR